MFDDLPLEEEWKHGLQQLVVVAARIQLETVSLEDTEHVLVYDLGMDEEMVRIMIDDFHPQILRIADALRESAPMEEFSEIVGDRVGTQCRKPSE